MSFITKRERVFNEYDLFDLPARNEGKLKAYASCTDARAWSHLCSDKTEHLVEIIKRNNETCRPKYVPTDVIVNTLMVAKNAEISRLKHRIEEFEQMLAAYDQLELTCDQKCEIADAHAAIKAANKELEDLCIDLDLSGFTEGVDSEAFETGKSRGDEPARYKISETPRSKEIEWSFDKDPTPKMETKSNQMGLSCPCDASTLATDPRIDELQETIIAKDAKLSAMQNTIAVMENDVCEPYCIYAHIYTALEKIFGILCQNDKYKQYLGLLTAGKDTRCIDVKGKILFKLKVLEKFGLALIAPCSQDFNTSNQECCCYRAEVVTRTETTFAITTAESEKPCLDNKRARLVADIMENDEMKAILSKDIFNEKSDEDHTDDGLEIDNYSIDTENLKRLKDLQENFDSLVTCYESLKYEKERLQIKCRNYEELEKELETMRLQLREYNNLWNEKEQYKKRSIDLDVLKEKYIVLTEEATDVEVRLKAENEINIIKSNTIEDLQTENVLLEKKLNQAVIEFEKEKNILQCKLKESECQVMCHEQQIKSLSKQIDRLLEQEKNEDFITDRKPELIALLDEIESLKEQTRNLKDALFYNEEEKQQLHNNFQDNLQLINELKMEIEDWRGKYEKLLQRNEHLENYTEGLRDEMHKLTKDVEDKSDAIRNLINKINRKSQEVERLMDELQKKSTENIELHSIRDVYSNSISNLEIEKNQAIKSLELARQESQDLIDKVKEYHETINNHKNLVKSLELKSADYEDIKNMLLNAIEENKNLQMNLASLENSNAILMQEIQRLREMNSYAVTNINSLQEEKHQFQHSLELTKKESEILEDKLIKYEDLSKRFDNLQKTHSNLLAENNTLEKELQYKNFELETAVNSIQINRKQSEELLNRLSESEIMKQNFDKIKHDYRKMAAEQQSLQLVLTEKKNEIENLLKNVNELKIQNDILSNKLENTSRLENELDMIKRNYDEQLSENKILQTNNMKLKNNIDKLNHKLETKIEENIQLKTQIKDLEERKVFSDNNISFLRQENETIQKNLSIIRRESTDLINKLKNYEALDDELKNLKTAYDQINNEKDILGKELDARLADLTRIQNENCDLRVQTQNLLTHSEDLEQALINARTELMSKPELNKQSYSNLIAEIAQINKEKNQNKTRIRELMDELDKSESVISNLTEDLLTRDGKIAILENHINQLEDEIRKLHITLDNIVDTGEQIWDHSNQKIDQSLKKIEAHHSKAAHNMKMELAKLQSENKLLEKTLSTTKMINEESSKFENDYLSQIHRLQNEKENIITQIKHLEIKFVGDSVITSNDCSVEQVLNSIDRIENTLETYNNKSISLEQTLLKVQSSSQLLLNKADEAKKIVEQKKLKIITEKEDAIKERMNMEKQVMELKEKLEKQISSDQDVIKDLEAEILNQSLIIDKINSSRQSYICKLENEMQSLQELYQNSIKKVTELQEQIKQAYEEKKEQLNIIEKANYELHQKSKEIATLQHEITQLQLKQKPTNSTETQVWLQPVKIDMESQTEKQSYSIYDDTFNEINLINNEVSSKIKNGINNVPQNNTYRGVIPRPQSINEVQILTANIEPSFDYVACSYKNHKLKQLSTCRLEYYSISTDIETTESHQTRLINGNDDNFFHGSLDLSNQTRDNYTKSRSDTFYTNVSEVIENKRNTNIQLNNDFILANDSLQSSVTRSFNNHLSNSLLNSGSNMSPAKDLFVIYKDSNSYKTNNNKASSSKSEHLDILIKEPTPGLAERKEISKKDLKRQHEKNNIEESNFKPTLNIKLPRIDTQSPSAVTSFNGNSNSLVSSILGKEYSATTKVSNSDIKLNSEIKFKDNSSRSLLSISEYDIRTIEKISYSPYVVHSGTKKENVMNKNGIPKTKTTDTTNKSKVKDDVTLPEMKKKSGDHNKTRSIKLAAEMLQYRNGKDSITSKSENNKYSGPRMFGLDYIMYTAEHKTDFKTAKTYDINNDLRETRSDDIFDHTILREKTNSSPSRLSPFKISSTEFNRNENKSIDARRIKYFKDQCVMVKLDNSEDYEKKIQYLTATLDNIEKHYKNKIEAIKIQYDNNIKCIINEHNQGVNNLQSLHEETLQDIIKIHENEVENLRTMSIEAMKKAEKLEKENKTLKIKIQEGSSSCLDAVPVRISSPELKRRRKSNQTKALTKTNVEAFNVKPPSLSFGPCTCSLDVNISDTIRNIFEEVDLTQRKVAEHTYLKYIVNKILTSNVDALDAQELAFLHLKVCRTWKTKMTKEEVLQKRINSLETELMTKQRHAQQHIAELDRKVAAERRRLQEVRDAVCRNSPPESRNISPEPAHKLPMPPPNTADKQFLCRCDTSVCTLGVSERKSAGDLAQTSTTGLRTKRTRAESNKAVVANLDTEERRQKKPYPDDLPTRLRKSHDRASRPHKK